MQDGWPGEIPRNPRGPSIAGIVSCVLAAPMLLLEVGLLVAVLAGVKDNQGVLYAAFPTLAVLVFGVPVCSMLALAGRREPGRSPTFADLGLRLTLGAALAAIAVLAAGSAVR